MNPKMTRLRKMMVERTNNRIISEEPLGRMKGRFKEVSPKTLTTSSSTITLAVIMKPGFIRGSVMAALVRADESQYSTPREAGWHGLWPYCRSAPSRAAEPIFLEEGFAGGVCYTQLPPLS